MQSSPRAPLRALVVICLVTGGWGFTFGVGTQTAPLLLADARLGDTAIGVNMAAYYLGIALAAAGVPGLMRRWGRGCPVAGMALSGVTVALFPWGGSQAGWLVIRALQGAAAALSLIPLETQLSQGAVPGHRSRNVGFFTASLTLGGALGIEVGTHLYGPGLCLPFYLAAAAAFVCTPAVAWGLPALEAAGETRHERTPLDVRGNFLSYATAWCQGFLEAGMFAFLVLYLLSLHMSPEGAGDLIGLTVVGVLLFQVPVGWLADRLGTTRVLLACYAVAALGLAVLPFCRPGPWVGVWLFVVGASSGAFYPLGLALLAARVRPGGLARAYSCYMTMECLGSMMGPVCMGPARSWAGERAMFAVGEAALLLVVLPWTALRLAERRPAVHGRCPENPSGETAARDAA